MPTVVFRKGDAVHTDVVKDNTNLVVRAGIKQFPYPNLSYQCGMGKCATCACQVLHGAEHLPPPNWKEKKQLGERVEQGWRLACQLWITHDIELAQPVRTGAAAGAGVGVGTTLRTSPPSPAKPASGPAGGPAAGEPASNAAPLSVAPASADPARAAPARAAPAQAAPTNTGKAEVAPLKAAPANDDSPNNAPDASARRAPVPETAKCS